MMGEHVYPRWWMRGVNSRKKGLKTRALCVHFAGETDDSRPRKRAKVLPPAVPPRTATRCQKGGRGAQVLGFTQAPTFPCH